MLCWSATLTGILPILRRGFYGQTCGCGEQSLALIKGNEAVRSELQGSNDVQYAERATSRRPSVSAQIPDNIDRK